MGSPQLFRCLSNSRYYFALLSNEEQVRLHRGSQELLLSSERTTLEVLPTI